MPPISRRRALQIGGLGVAAAVVGAGGLTWQLQSGSGGGLRLDAGAGLAEPEILRSVDGLLEVELRAAEGPRRVAGREVTALGYNGGLPGPTLRLHPGDRLGIRLVNDLPDVTNLHVHGLVVSPEGNADNVFVEVAPGEFFDHEYRLPDDHPPGVYWYHPHRHHLVADQVFGGLYGAIVVEDPDPVPVARERVLVVSDIGFDGSGRVREVSAMERMAGREGELVLVDGQLEPVMTARPGERERWRVVNACTSRYLRLRLDGQDVRLLGIDSGRFAAPRPVDEIVLLPGNRADLLVTAIEGTSTLESGAVDRGGMGGMGMGGGGMGGGGGPGPAGGAAAGTLAVLEVRGDPVPAATEVPAFPAPRDLRGAEVTGSRRLAFGMGMGGGTGGMRFLLDGREFDPARVDQSVAFGAVEEWTITNATPMNHPLHLHVWPMQVVAEGGRPVDEVRWQDVVDVPSGGAVTVRIAFDRFAGRTVYHCHILDHEDLGMMAVIEVR